MPIYEFKCRDCGKEYETLILRSSDGPSCPGCGSPSAEKLLSSFRSLSGGNGEFAGGGGGGSSSCGGCHATSCAGCGSRG